VNLTLGKKDSKEISTCNNKQNEREEQVGEGEVEQKEKIILVEERDPIMKLEEKNVAERGQAMPALTNKIKDKKVEENNEVKYKGPVIFSKPWFSFNSSEKEKSFPLVAAPKDFLRSRLNEKYFYRIII